MTAGKGAKVIRNSWALVMGGLLAVAVLLQPACTIENVLGTSYLTPDAKWSVTIYSRTCSRRLSNKNREDWVVALRPMSEPAPQPADYSESEVVFEVEKGSPQLELVVTAPSGMAQFGYLSEAERQHSLLVMCYPDCTLRNVRKQLHSWNDIPIHYFLEEKTDEQPITQ
jgi:hypothetical protein